MTDPAPECAALAERLRALRARTGLSLAALAERTPYSKSSWERYLNGRPSRHSARGPANHPGGCSRSGSWRTPSGADAPAPPHRRRRNRSTTPGTARRAPGGTGAGSPSAP